MMLRIKLNRNFTLCLIVDQLWILDNEIRIAVGPVQNHPRTVVPSTGHQLRSTNFPIRSIGTIQLCSSIRHRAGWINNCFLQAIQCWPVQSTVIMSSGRASTGTEQRAHVLVDTKWTVSDIVMMINNNHADEYEEVEEDQCPVVVVKSQMDMDMESRQGRMNSQFATISDQSVVECSCIKCSCIYKYSSAYHSSLCSSIALKCKLMYRNWIF